MSRALREQPRLLAVTAEGDDMPKRTCSIEGCERPVRSRGWCGLHYNRWRRHGDPLVQGLRPRGKSSEFEEWSQIEGRFWPKVAVPANALDCWLWQAALDPQSGYGRIQVNGTTGYAHRVSYELSIGPIGAALQIDHLCRNRACVNPLHLQAVPPAVNQQRRPDRAVTHCPQGHPYLGDNLRVSHGRRYCRACALERSRTAKSA